MQATGVSLMRRLSSAIHPQLPLDARQTSQLLASLTSSFQRHLDQAHPVPQSSGSQKLPSSLPSLSSDVGERKHIQSSFSETTNHFESIISHPSFAGLQHSPGSRTSLPEKRALAALKTAEQRLKYGNFNVFEAADLFRTIHASAISVQPRAHLSFASSFVALLKSSGASSVQQFFSIAGMAPRWVQLMFHESRDQEILQVMRETGCTTPLLSYSLATLLRSHGLSRFVAEMERIDRLVRSDYISLSDDACKKAMLLVAHTLFRHSTDDITITHLRTQLERNIMTTRAPAQTELLLSNIQLVDTVKPDADSLLTFVKALEHNEDESTYWTATPFRRRLLLESTLKAAALLCQHERHADAQFLLEFSEVVFAEELQISKQSRDAHLATQQKASVREEEAVLSRLDGLLPS